MTQDHQRPLLGSVERIAMQRKDCPICESYARVRGPRIRAEIRRTTPIEQRAAKWWRFMAGVHKRHDASLTFGRIAALMGAVREFEEETR